MYCSVYFLFLQLTLFHCGYKVTSVELQVRWTEQSHAFKSETERLVGDVLLLTGFLSYSGPFNQEYRNLLQAIWFDNLLSRKIPVTQNLNITENLVDAPTVSTLTFKIKCPVYLK